MRLVSKPHFFFKKQGKKEKGMNIYCIFALSNFL